LGSNDLNFDGVQNQDFEASNNEEFDNEEFDNEEFDDEEVRTKSLGLCS